MEAERPGLALELHFPFAIDQVEAVGPTGIGGLGMVFEPIDESWELDPKLTDTAVGDRVALIHVTRSGEDDFVFDVALHLPNVAWVRLENVHRVESDFTAILLCHRVENGNLPPKRRSSIAAENEYDRRVCE